MEHLACVIKCDENGQPFIEVDNPEAAAEFFSEDDLPFLTDDPDYEDDEETTDFTESAFIEWHRQGYFEPHGLTKDGRINWGLTPWGKRHIRDITRMKANE